MQLEQNLFSLSRIILKLPKFILLAVVCLLIFIATTQIYYIFNIAPVPIDISKCLFQYLIQKNKDNKPDVDKQTNISNYQYKFVNVRSLIRINKSQTSNCSFKINYTQTKDNEISKMVIAQTYSFLFNNQYNASYNQKHEIITDYIFIPIPDIKKPQFYYYFTQNDQQNQYLFETILTSFDKMLSMFDQYKNNNTQKNMTLSLESVYLKYKYPYYNHQIEQSQMNVLNQLYFKSIAQPIIKTFGATYSFYFILITSTVTGLFIRYIIITSYTVFIIVFDKCLKQSWGWSNQYLIILYKRFRQHKWSTFKMLFFYIISNIGMNLLITIGSYLILRQICYGMLHMNYTYRYLYLKLIFVSQLFFYIFCRARTSIKYYPILSLLVNMIPLVINFKCKYGSIMLLINLVFTLQFILFVIFLIIQKFLQEQNKKGFINDLYPSYDKPRMLFFAGFDITWQKSLPPIWTYFTRWFDYSVFTEAQKSYLNRDYQLLYGRMLGLNQRQQIPEQQQELREQRINDQPSNQMNLIQADM